MNNYRTKGPEKQDLLQLPAIPMNQRCVFCNLLLQGYDKMGNASMAQENIADILTLFQDLFEPGRPGIILPDQFIGSLIIYVDTFLIKNPEIKG